MGVSRHSYVEAFSCSRLSFHTDKGLQAPTARDEHGTLLPFAQVFAFPGGGMLPDILGTLNAAKFVREAGRMVSFCGHPGTKPGQPRRLPLQLPECTSHLGLIKGALLVFEAALPHGILDETFEKWSTDVEEAWTDAVVMADDAVDLMACLLFIEACIRTAWLKPTNKHCLWSLQNRTHALKHATVSSVALRLWMLDQLVRYNKTY